MTATPPLLLLVDDAPELAYIVRRLGRQAGCEVADCGNAGAAWEYLRQAARAPDLVLLDLNLPGESGAEWCARLRDHPTLADLPVAVFTPEGAGEAVAAGLDAGADFVVCKDLLTRPDAWAGRLREVLAAARQPPALAAPGWLGTGSLCPTAADVIQRLNRGLCQPAVRQAGPAVLRALTRRALSWARWWRTGRHEGEPVPRPSPRLRDAATEDSLRPGGLALTPELAGRLGPPENALAFAVALAEQVHRVLGPPAAAPLVAELAGVVPTLADVLACP